MGNMYMFSKWLLTEGSRRDWMEASVAGAGRGRSRRLQAGPGLAGLCQNQKEVDFCLQSSEGCKARDRGMK
jgi:hypothetical protein